MPCRTTSTAARLLGVQPRLQLGDPLGQRGQLGLGLVAVDVVGVGGVVVVEREALVGVDAVAGEVGDQRGDGIVGHVPENYPLARHVSAMRAACERRRRCCGHELRHRSPGPAQGFGDTQALDGVDLAARTGTVHGVLGPNGAGKTTAVRILATLLQADEGTAFVAGHDVAREPARVREQIGLTGQYASVDELLTGRQNLELIGALLDLKRQRRHARARRNCSPGST